jgi:hypothetical protein
MIQAALARLTVRFGLADDKARTVAGFWTI